MHRVGRAYSAIEMDLRNYGTDTLQCVSVISTRHQGLFNYKSTNSRSFFYPLFKYIISFYIRAILFSLEPKITFIQKIYVLDLKTL